MSLIYIKPLAVIEGMQAISGHDGPGMNPNMKHKCGKIYSSSITRKDMVTTSNFGQVFMYYSCKLEGIPYRWNRDWFVIIHGQLKP